MTPTLLFICIFGNITKCTEPIHVIAENDWYVFWLNIGFSALITAASVIFAIILNDWNDKRKLKNTTKKGLNNELIDILKSINDPQTKLAGTTFDGEPFSYTPYQFHTISFQSLIDSGTLLLLDQKLQSHVRDSYSLVIEHNDLLSEIDQLLPNTLLHEVYNYRGYMGYIERIQVNLTGLEREMAEEFQVVLNSLSNS